MIKRIKKEIACIVTTALIMILIIKIWDYFGVRNDFIAGAWSMITYYRTQSAYDLAFA